MTSSVFLKEKISHYKIDFASKEEENILRKKVEYICSVYTTSPLQKCIS